MTIKIEHHKSLFVKFMDIKINVINYCDTYELMTHAISNGDKEYICLTDVANVINSNKDEQLRTAINSAFLSLADGAPLAYYARLAGYNRIERISGVQLMELLFTEKDGLSHFLLGDTDQTIKKVINKARTISKNINITGYSPPFKEFTAEDNCYMAEKIRKANPDIIWVSFGGGKQEKWMKDHIDSIEKGIMIGIGAALRWFVGDIKVPPVMFQKLCLQWFYRLMSESIKDPQKGINLFIKTQLKQFPVFLMNFPSELATARRQFKDRVYSEKIYLSYRCGECSKCDKRECKLLTS